MSIDLETEQSDLRDIVKRVELKERRILRSSLLFSSLAFVVGFAWMGYSVNKVLKLNGRATELRSEIETLTQQKADLEQQFRQVEAKTLEAIKVVSQAQGNGEAVTKTALTALSDVQKEVQIAINTPSKEIPTVEATPSKSSTPTTRVAIPDVKGSSFAQASQVLRKAGFQVIRTDEPGRGIPGTVLYQDPAAGVPAPVGHEVKLYIAKEIVSVTVPNVVGLTFAEANKRLLAAGLTVIKADENGKGIPGTVLYQDPVPGNSGPKGRPVKLYVKPIGDK